MNFAKYYTDNTETEDIIEELPKFGKIPQKKKEEKVKKKNKKRTANPFKTDSERF